MIDIPMRDVQLIKKTSVSLLNKSDMNRRWSKVFAAVLILLVIIFIGLACGFANCDADFFTHHELLRILWVRIVMA